MPRCKKNNSKCRSRPYHESAERRWPPVRAALRHHELISYISSSALIGHGTIHHCLKLGNSRNSDRADIESKMQTALTKYIVSQDSGYLVIPVTSSCCCESRLQNKTRGFVFSYMTLSVLSPTTAHCQQLEL